MGALFEKMATGWGFAAALVRGWRTPEKIVVIESDDWGAIRTASREAYERLLAAGYAMDRSCYSLDALETSEDLDLLFEVLESVRDGAGRPACVTANMIMANPDFERIRRGRFREYFYEPVSATLSRLPGRAEVTARWAQGARRRAFVPQLHAREHVRWWEWLSALRDGWPEAVTAFEMGMCGVPMAASKTRRSFFDCLYLADDELQRQDVDLEAMITEGAGLFEKQFGHKALSVMAPNYCWTDTVEQIWGRLGVRYIQGMPCQYVGSTKRRRFHYLGQRGTGGGYYLVRNGRLEPSRFGPRSVQRCLREVARAFRFHRPAIICSHRVNYIGSIEPRNRAEGLRQLKALLEAICRRWPEVRFLSSPELGGVLEGRQQGIEGPLPQRPGARRG